MSGDYTRFTFEPRNDYSGVLKQQVGSISMRTSTSASRLSTGNGARKR